MCLSLSLNKHNLPFIPITGHITLRQNQAIIVILTGAYISNANHFTDCLALGLFRDPS